MIKKPVIINLFGGPGSGKSTIAAGLFQEMKLMGYKVELVTEYAKELTYLKSHNKMRDQLHIFATQHHKIWQCIEDVDFIITDSPLLISSVYVNDNYSIDKALIKNFILSVFLSYNNINFFVERGVEYQTYGRSQNKDEALILDDIILELMSIYDINATRITHQVVNNYKTLINDHILSKVELNG